MNLGVSGMPHLRSGEGPEEFGVETSWEPDFRGPTIGNVSVSDKAA